MLKPSILALLAGITILIGCVQPDPIGGSVKAPSGRELRPAKTNIDVGSLYYVREEPTSELSTAADLQDLCIFELSPDQQADLSTKSLPDIDVLRDLEANGELSGIKTKAVSAGVSGDLQDYFSYKLTNVREVSISLVEAGNVFDSQAFRTKCNGWRSNIEDTGWAAYQVLSIIVGDMVFERSSNAEVDAELSAKLGKIEPKLKQALKRSFSRTLTGDNLVVSFNPKSRR